MKKAWPNQNGTVSAELLLYSIEPHHSPPLSFRDRLPHLAAIDALARRIDRPRAAFRLFPIVLESASAPVLCFIDLMMRMQLRQRIATDRTKRNDLVAGFKSQGIVDLNSRHFCVERQILRASVICL